MLECAITEVDDNDCLCARIVSFVLIFLRLFSVTTRKWKQAAMNKMAATSTETYVSLIIQVLKKQ